MAIYEFPKQKVSDSVKKTEKWQHESIDAAISAAVNNRSAHNDKYEDAVNFDLYNNRLHMDDLLRSINKDGLLGKTFPDLIENHPIMSPKISLLVGEEMKRRFDFNVAVSTPNVIIEKDSYVHEAILTRLEELMDPTKTPDMSRKDVENEVKRLSRWKKYGYRDIREMMVTNILHYYYEEQNLKNKFSRGFINAIISGKEFYDIDIYDSKIVVDVIDPRNLYYILGKDTIDLEDAEIIVYSSYLSPSAIVDKYYEWLTPAQIDEIENYISAPVKNTSGVINYTENYNEQIEILPYDGLLTREAYINSDGNIRVDKVLWESRRKVGKLLFINEDGEDDYRLVPEQYKPDEAAGEEVKWFWINEWWEGTRIGEDIYVKIKPRPIQFRGVDNISLSKPGIVGSFYPGASLVSKAKPYQYLYNIIAYKVQKTIAKYKGPMIELDLAKIPSGWDMSKWFKIGDETGFLPVDSFKEGNRGAATGKLAGNFNTSGKEYNQNAGGYFNDMFNLMSYIDNTMGSIIGVSKQREGQIQNRETVGGVERAVTQSSHITEELFSTHDYTRLKVMKVIVENAKYLYKNKKSQMMQYLMDDTIINSFVVDGELLNESDYAVMITNSNNIEELIQSFKQLAPELIRANKANFSNLMDIYLSKSLAETRRSIENIEAESEERDAKRAEEQNKLQQEQMQRAAEMKQQEIELEKYKIDANNAADIKIQEMKNDVEREKLASQEQEAEDSDLRFD
jgi:hypothetical protein